MLGEDHSLVNEFPQFKEKIAKLSKVSQEFSVDAARYHALDAEIRDLELKNAPIDDETLHQLKKERALLKDKLYQMIVTS